APDFSVYYEPGAAAELRFFVSSEGDTTLVINGPDGAWTCDDDSGGSLQPMIVFAGPQGGRYDVWIGSYGPDEFLLGTLYVSELPTDPSAYPYSAEPAVLPIIGGDANYGSSELVAGFTPDPFTAEIVSGGDVDVQLAMGEICQGTPRGFVAWSPDYYISYEAGSAAELTFFFEGDGDTTLVINGPNGFWYCDDDSHGNLQPEITFLNPQSGYYDIWVGSYAAEQFYNGTLSITEVGGTGNNPVVSPLDSFMVAPEAEAEAPAATDGGK
ncbi:MAG: hypothetical protein JW910_23025, partial [Anaerolineae bacterium]|nr:hypothetical protein [Anaerolineae bacterium]